MDSIRACLGATICHPGWGPFTGGVTAVGAIVGGVAGFVTGIEAGPLAGLTAKETVGCAAGLGVCGGAGAALALAGGCIYCSRKDEDDTQSQQGTALDSKQIKEQPVQVNYINNPHSRSSSGVGYISLNPFHALSSYSGYFHGASHDGGYSSGGCIDGGHSGCDGGGGGCGGE